MQQRLIRYRTKPDQAATNTELVRAVYAELHQANPDGFRPSMSATQLTAAPLEDLSAERSGYSALPIIILYIRMSRDIMTRQRKDHCREFIC